MQVQLLSYEQRVAAHTAAFLFCLRGAGNADDEEEPMECEDCSGSGDQFCSKCDGEGEIECECSACGDDHFRSCRTCDGAGTIGECRSCHGSGESIDPDTVLIPHPADEWIVPSLLPLSINDSFT